jgi:hypothetical protein
MNYKIVVLITGIIFLTTGIALAQTKINQPRQKSATQESAC